MADGHLLAYGLAGFLLLYVVARAAGSKLDYIPTIGPSGPLASYWGVIKYIFRGKEMAQEGYRKYPNGIFKVPLLHNWLVFCSSPQMVEDIRKASESEFSRVVAIDNTLQTRYTFGQEIRDNEFHVPMIRSNLTRNLAVCYPEILDEVQQAFEDNLSLNGNEWRSFNAMKLILSVVCRTTNRLCVGLPLCRDLEYLGINTDFTIDVMITANFLRSLPRFLRHFVGERITKRHQYRKRLRKLVGEMLEERLKMEKQYGNDWPGKPNDMVSWLLEKAPPHLHTVDEIIVRILAVNFSAIHTSALNFAHALYHLAAEPEHAEILREEVETIVKEEGWTKDAIDRMIKVDSFLRESQRVNGLSSHVLSRVIVKDFTFSNGIVIPAGTTIVVPMHAMHHDEANYPDPYKFDPYRFARQRENNMEDAKLQLVTPSADFLPWGYGKYACPGRFFAANELKTMIAHIVTSYDVKLKVEGVRPSNSWLAGVCLPDRNAEVMFRRRTLL